ncbi:uncharacterized protein V3H82_013323 [Fundulus diaphanus]
MAFVAWSLPATFCKCSCRAATLILRVLCCSAVRPEAEIEQQLLQVMKSGKKSSSWRHSGETGGKQELKERQDAAEETPMMGDVFQPRVLLHRLDVKEEAPEEQSPEGEQQESEPLHIKEEQEEPGARQEGEQLLVKEETDTSFPLTAAPINDVAQKPIVKEEASLDQRPRADLHEPSPPHIKEEEKGVYISLQGVELNGTEVKDLDCRPAISVPGSFSYVAMML